MSTPSIQTDQEIIEELTEALEVCRQRLRFIHGRLVPHNYATVADKELHDDVHTIEWCLKEAERALISVYEKDVHPVEVKKMKGVLESQTREHAQRVADTLNEFVGALHGARCTGILWAKDAENPSRRSAAKYGLQGSFLITALTLRKFMDLWEHHLSLLLPDGVPSRTSCEELIADCNVRKLRTTANHIIAHYAPRKEDWPLSSGEIQDLIRSNGWTTEEEVLNWVGEVIPKIISIRDELKHRYKLERLRDEEVNP